MSRISLMLITLVFTCYSHAAVYQCKDTNGNTSFSDTPCTTANISSIGKTVVTETKPAQKEAYTKDAPAIKVQDPAVQACYNFINTTALYPDPSSTKLLSSSKKWVSVKDVGARQMITIVTSSKNEAGMYVGRQSNNCLLQGDGLTINTRQYELL